MKTRGLLILSRSDIGRLMTYGRTLRQRPQSTGVRSKPAPAPGSSSTREGFVNHDGKRRTFLAAAGALVAGKAVRAAAQGGRQMTRIDFEAAPVGALPPGVTAALTGSGGPVKWSVTDDPTAPAGPKVLTETSKDTTDYRFPLAIFDQPVLADLDVAARFKAVAGEVDRAAGIAVRLADRNNYYVVRANALEDDVRLYKVVAGQRRQFAGANVKVPSGTWQELRLLARGNHFEVFLEGKSLYSATDMTFAAAGHVALWTKADSVTYFDDLRIQPL
jgi:hypothetical protein